MRQIVHRIELDGSVCSVVAVMVKLPARPLRAQKSERAVIIPIDVALRFVNEGK